MTTDAARAHSPLLRRLWHTPLRDIARGRLTARLDIAGLLVAAELPAPIPDTIRTTTRKTRLWRLEQTDVARELIAHFRDGLNAGTPPELVAAFGDPVITARLIRRAKKRNRKAAGIKAVGH